MNIEWTVSTSATTLHAAAWLMAGGRCVEQSAADALAEAAEATQQTFSGAGLRGRADAWIDRAASLAAAGHGSAREIADRLIARHLGAKATAKMTASLAAALGNLIATGGRWLDSRSRSLADEIALRRGPMLQQWEARGPGLLRSIADVTESNLLVESARVCLVLPIAAGHGVAYPVANAVRLEAVLANPHDDVPETVRLAWLLAQLNADLPPLVEYVPAGRAEALMKLAMVPATLAAAEQLGMCQCDATTIGRAMQCWHFSAAEVESAAELANWWNTYEARRPAWPVALAALAELVPDN